MYSSSNTEGMVYHLENTTSKLAISNPQTPLLPMNNNTSTIQSAMRLSNTTQNNSTSLSMNINSQKVMKAALPPLPPMPTNTNFVSQPQWATNIAPASSSSAVVSNMEYLPQSTRTTDTDESNPQDKNKINRVKVVVRVRPPITEDASNSLGEFVDCTTISRERKNLLLRRNSFEERDFNFDHVLEQATTQEQMYQTVAENVVNDVLKGYNGTILAYGQTGSGKTFTIFGPGTHWELGDKRSYKNSNIDLINTEGEFVLSKFGGIIPRSIHHIFQHVIRNQEKIEFRVAVSFLQIYMENIMDLLDASKTNLSIREDPKLGIFVENITTVVVQEPQDIIQLIREGAQNRAVSSTHMNKKEYSTNLNAGDDEMLNDDIPVPSGRKSSMSSTSSNSATESQCVKRGTLTIVDLAGSERVKKSGSEGQTLEEAKKINKSLSALGNCVAALIDDNMTYVPFRDSKLTRLLTDSLGGNSKTCLVATIGPSIWNYDESLSTLQFATRCMSVKNHAVINEVVDFKTLTGNLQKKISLIENEKYRLMLRNGDLEREVAVLKSELLELHNRVPTVVGNMQPNAPKPPNPTPAADNNVIHQQYEQREKEMVAKFTNVIHHLQMEISKQQQPVVEPESGDEILDQLINGMLKIPAVKKRLLEKLLPEMQVEQSRVNSPDAASNTSTTVSTPKFVISNMLSN